MADGYRLALLDWLACAARGAREPAAVAARATGDGLLERVAAAGAAGHVLDFDDTYGPGLAHLSAATAPAAVVLGAELGADVGAVLDAYAAGFEAMGALARTLPPGALRRRLASDERLRPGRRRGRRRAPARARRRACTRRDRARAAALRRPARGVRLGRQGAAGRACCRRRRAGRAPRGGRRGRRRRGDRGRTRRLRRGLRGARRARRRSTPCSTPRARSSENWIKAYPCCLQTHARDRRGARGRRARPAPGRRSPSPCTPSRGRPPRSTRSATASRRSSRSPT